MLRPDRLEAQAGQRPWDLAFRVSMACLRAALGRVSEVTIFLISR
ncbi:hypothetical protein ACQI5H_23245 [Mycobacterium heidelbergense]